MRERPIAETDITAVLGLLEALPENDDGGLEMLPIVIDHVRAGSPARR